METNDLIKYVSDGFEKAKAGEAAGVYAAVADMHDRGALPARSHYPFGWIIYYAMHQSAAHAVGERKQMLARYLRLSVAKPHKLHSMILTEAIRLYKEAAEAAEAARQKSGSGRVADLPTFSLVRFVGLWDLANLRPGDWRRKDHEGIQLPSTVEKLITHCVDELYESRSPVPADFKAVVERALEEYPGASGLYARRARIYELDGDTAGAIDMLRKAILVSPAKFFLWSRLAALITGRDSLRLRVSLLCRAIACPGQEDFKGRIHLALADTLAEGGAHDLALWELNHVKDTYAKKGWNLPRLLRDTESKIPEGTVATDPARVYRRIAHLADDFLYESLPGIEVRKTYHKPGGETTDRYGRRRMAPTAWRATDGEGRNYWFSPSRYGIPEDLAVGTQLIIKAVEGKVVKAEIQGGGNS